MDAPGAAPQGPQHDVASTEPTGDSIDQLVDHLFRREASKMVAALTRSFGPAHLALAEEVVQDALLKALRRWPFHGIPEKPTAWLYRVARNLALDRLRRDTNFRGKEEAIRQRLEVASHGLDDEGGPRFDGEVTDDQLRLIFLCCHPELPRDARVALTLKSVMGLSVREISRAFLSRETTIAQRLVRAQRRIRERRFAFEMPAGDELPARLDAVLEALYLLFNEGYGSHSGDALVRADLCREALRLARCLAAHPGLDRPETHALAALLGFQASRLPARLDAAGALRRLADQDRGLWDRRTLGFAFAHLARATQGDEETVYHLQAAIAAHHAMAATTDATDWPAILGLYDRLLERNPSPIVALNRAVAVAHCQGPEAGLEAIAKIADHPAVASYYLLEATRGEFLVRAGRPEEARAAYRAALECQPSDPERRFLEAQMERLAP